MSASIIGLSAKQRRLAFAAALSQAFDRNNTTSSTLAKELRISYHRVHYWAKGRSMPSYQMAMLIANHLSDDQFMRAVTELHKRTCVNCGSQYMQDSSQGRSFLCSPRCRVENERVRSKSGKSVISQAVFKEKNPYKLAVKKFCMGCEPSGVCVTASCALRPVSPLPLLSKSQAIFSSGGTTRNVAAKSK